MCFYISLLSEVQLEKGFCCPKPSFKITDLAQYSRLTEEENEAHGES